MTKLYRLMTASVLCLTLMSLSPFTSSAEDRTDGITRLESPYYTFPRSGNRHVDLSEGWKLTSTDSQISSLSELDGAEFFDVATPAALHMAYYRAGKLPHPYAHENSDLYLPLESKAHYYTRTFDTPDMEKDATVILAFDGIDYTAKVWVNGTLMGMHQGMFGGPSIRIDQVLRHDGGKNQITVEVLSAAYNNPDYNAFTPKEYIRSWGFSHSRGEDGGVTPFLHMGIWNGIRLEILSHYHIERPFMTTKSIKDGCAVIDFSTEIFCGTNSKDYTLHPWEGGQGRATWNGTLVKDDVKVVVRLSEEGRVAYEKTFNPTVIEGRCWMEESFELKNPKLWYPNQMGSPDFYQASVLLFVNGKQVDEIDFDFGVRTIEHVRSAGIRIADRWNDWQYVINGEKVFIKGMNWTPLDLLSDLPYENYEWAIRAAKDMGIQLFRIWGTGYMETEEFYDCCNKYGIMVWQDFTIANCDTPEWPQQVWEAQVCQNIFRLRNQPSLAVWCGGNEFNPYSLGNALSIGIIERNLREFDPTRPFWRTTPDGGSDHMYYDFDPNTYKVCTLLPYIAETGIHCLTNARLNRTLLKAGSCEGLGKLIDDSFRTTNAEFVHHFGEYLPERVPRMLSRASHIEDMTDPVYEDMVIATQVGAGEFYQVMSEGVQSNYPVTTGLMPWTYKRPWPVVAAIQLMDGFGQPTAPYYFMKRTYEKTHVLVDLPKMLFAPGDEIPLKANVLNGVGCADFDGSITISILDDRFKELQNASKEVKVGKGTSVTKTCLGDFKVPSDYHNKFFFIIAKLKDGSGKVISRSLYWPRTIPQMENAEYHDNYLKNRPEWPTLKEGPWLKPTVAANKTVLAVTTPVAVEGGYKITITNKGKFMSPMTIIDTDKGVNYASDNFFCLEAGETKDVIVNIKSALPSDVIPTSIIVSSWNARTQTLKLN